MIEGLKPYDSYRAASVPWAPILPAHWTTERGKALFTQTCLPVPDGAEIVTCFRDGQVTLRKNRRTRGFMLAFYEAGYQGIRKGQLVVHAMDAFAGAIGVSDSNGKCTPEYIVCNARTSDILLEYYAIVLRHAAHQDFIRLSCPAVRERAPRFRYPNLGIMQLPFPPVSEQAAIVRFLNHANRRIDRFIRAKKKLIALLNEQKQAIIHRAVTSGLNRGQRRTVSGIPWIREIPNHWSILRLQNVLMGGLANGIFKRGDSYGSGVPLVNVKDIFSPDGVIDATKLARVQASATEIESYMVFSGDLFFVRSSLKLEGTGQCAMIEDCLPGTIFECHVVKCSPAKEKVLPRYLVVMLNSWGMRNVAISAANTVTMSTLSQGALKSLPILLPPLEDQKRILANIDDQIRPIALSERLAAQQIDLLREYRTRLIADVVTGQLDVREAVKGLPVEDGDDGAPVDAGDEIDEAEIDDSEQGEAT